MERFVLTSFLLFFLVNHRERDCLVFLFLIFFTLVQGDFELPFKSIISTARFAQLFLCQFCLISKTMSVLLCVYEFSLHIPKSDCCVNKAHFSLGCLIRSFSLCFDKARVDIRFLVFFDYFFILSLSFL